MDEVFVVKTTTLAALPALEGGMWRVPRLYYQFPCMPFIEPKMMYRIVGHMSDQAPFGSSTRLEEIPTCRVACDAPLVRLTSYKRPNVGCSQTPVDVGSRLQRFCQRSPKPRC